eukprot:TRINITY_DN40232_c0_g1_i3.p1 TRINITY_DN40232_c0_g1~~TRINITY_DN40232_c0_g1_i3.p1  ORF type:complete len:195 (-),score=15.50 TRINITY_DN40232_c0_g1_i3:182-766(-)
MMLTAIYLLVAAATCYCQEFDPFSNPRNYHGFVHSGETVQASMNLSRPECAIYYELFYKRNIDDGGSVEGVAYCDYIRFLAGNGIVSRRIPRSTQISPDWEGPGWYRFVGPSGTTMPEKSPEQNHCGSEMPGWVAGKHPETPGERKEITICFARDNVGCDFDVQAEITNCGSYFVYKLPNTRCNARYCSKTKDQ